MVTWTRAYALVQAGARQGLVLLPVKSEIFPGMSEPDYLEGAWYDWAVAELLLREWDKMLAQAEQSINRVQGRAPSLEDLAIVRAAAQWHSLRGDWAQALTSAQYCRQSNQQDSLDHATADYLNAAIACLKLGDDQTYLHLREEMATRFKDAAEVAPWRTLEVGLVRPIDDRVAATFKAFADGLVRWSRIDTNDSWGLMLASLHAYRLGDYIGAMDLGRQSLARVDGAPLPNAELGIISALSLYRLGNRSAASSELEHAEAFIRTGFDLDYDIWHWPHWVLVRLLLQEARGLISPPLQPSAAPP
jgi:tetratricopeptide (TPR) repeat protein